MLWISLPWISWSFGTRLSETKFGWLIFAISSQVAIWSVFTIGSTLIFQIPINIKSEPSILANVEKDEPIKMDVGGNHVREHDTAEADACGLSSKESAERTSLYHTSISQSEDNSEFGLDYLSQGSPIFGPTATRGREKPTSSYGSESAEKFAQIFAQAIPVRQPKRTFQPPEIKITGPGSSSPQSAQTAGLRSRKATSTSCRKCHRRKQRVLLILLSVKSIKTKDLNSATKQKMARATTFRTVFRP
jgi:hypothetical protein